jgi:hypothetical protein
MSRRFYTLKKDPAYLLVIIFGCIVCHMSFFFAENMVIELYPLAFVMISFAGFKYGRMACLLTGLSTFVCWTVLKIALNLEIDSSYFGSQNIWLANRITITDDITVSGQSVADFLLLSFFGWCFTVGLERLERALAGCGLTVDDILTKKVRFWIHTLFETLGVLFTTKEPTDEDKAKETGAEIEAEYNLKKGFSFKIKVQLKRLLLLLVIAVMFVTSLHFQFDFFDEVILFSPIPMYAGIVFVLTFCFYRGWLQTLVLLVVYGVISTALTLSDTFGDFYAYYGALFENWSMLILIVVAAWWLDKIVKAWQCVSTRRKLLRLNLFRALKRYQPACEPLPIGAIFLLLIFTFSASITIPPTLSESITPAVETVSGEPKVARQIVDTIVITGDREASRFYGKNMLTFNPVMVLLAILLIFCQRYSVTSISNAVLSFVLLLSLFQFDFSHFTGKTIAIATNHFDALELIFLVVVPLVYRFFALGTISGCRAVIYGASFILLSVSTLSYEFRFGLTLDAGKSDYTIFLGILFQLIINELLSWLIYYLHQTKWRKIKAKAKEEATPLACEPDEVVTS